jgi:3-oxoacyl-[acyl-carrier-protein] synthase-3
MRYHHVCIEALSAVLPPEVLTSAEIERRLRPLYERLRLPEGRLELMTGIRERRLWPPGTPPSEASAAAGRQALAAAGVEPGEVDCLFHAAVSRDYLEPATATAVHRLLGLPGHALNFDISNACLGVLSAMIAAAALIELGQAEVGLVVAGENSRPLTEATLEHLLTDASLTRQSVKEAFASLTIGSAATAVVLTRDRRSRTGHRLLGGAAFANTAYDHLCRGSADGGMAGAARPLMSTDAEELLVRGIETAVQTWALFCAELGWNAQTPDLVCTHQVGRIHRDRLFAALGLDPARDFPTIEFMGNTGSAALPGTAALAIEAGRLRPGQRLAMLGIGSGINCTMLGIEW